MARFPAGDVRPGDLPGSVQQPIGPSVPREIFRKRREDVGRKRRRDLATEEAEEQEVEEDDDGGDAPARLAWHSQKAAPLVVRVIDDRENMRARKKGPPARPPRSYAESCRGDETCARPARTSGRLFRYSRCGLPERAMITAEPSIASIVLFRFFASRSLVRDSYLFPEHPVRKD